MSAWATPYRPSFSNDQRDRLRRWHEAAYDAMRSRGEIRQTYLGLDLVVPAEIFAPAPMSDLLGAAVLEDVREQDRVLDMGTGSGVNAILAASKSGNVTGVDINPYAVAAAKANAARNGVGDRTSFAASNLFDDVEGSFDLIIFDPPFRWFRPRDLLEASIADENYQSLTRFMEEAPSRLNPGGRILLFFGTSGDFEYLASLIDRADLTPETIAMRVLVQDGLTVTYSTQRLQRSGETPMPGTASGGRVTCTARIRPAPGALAAPVFLYSGLIDERNRGSRSISTGRNRNRWGSRGIWGAVIVGSRCSKNAGGASWSLSATFESSPERQPTTWNATSSFTSSTPPSLTALNSIR